MKCHSLLIKDFLLILLTDIKSILLCNHPTLKNMKKILLLFILFLTTLALPAQIVTLTFTGKDGNNKTIKLEFVHITNLTKGWDLTLPVHDTILTMGTSGVEEFEETNTLRINQNVHCKCLRQEMCH